MKFKHDIGISYLNNLQNAWYANDAVDIREIQGFLDNFKKITSGIYYTLPIFFIIDYTSRQYLLMTDRLKEVSGYHPQEFLETRLDKLLDVFHKDDFNIFNNKIFSGNTSFLSAVPFSDHHKYIFSYSYRFVGSNKKYVNVLQRTTYITSPDTGLPLFSLGALTDITDFKTDAVMVHTIEECDDAFGKRTIQRNFYYPDEQDAVLTNREKEVLLYMADGLSSKQIADKLKLSENTIDNHRQNMLRKTNARNVAQLVAFAIRNRII